MLDKIPTTVAFIGNDCHNSFLCHLWTVFEECTIFIPLEIHRIDWFHSAYLFEIFQNHPKEQLICCVCKYLYCWRIEEIKDLILDFCESCSILRSRVVRLVLYYAFLLSCIDYIFHSVSKAHDFSNLERLLSSNHSFLFCKDLWYLLRVIHLSLLKKCYWQRAYSPQ